jgi:hypothetical protein
MDRPFPAYDGDDPYVFVSYSHKDSDAVFPEMIWLKESGFNIWYDEGIEAGTEWREEIAQAIKKTNLCIYFVTPDSAQSENCRKEVNLADKQQIPIIAIYLKVTDLPGSLDLTLSDRQAILKFCCRFLQHCRKPTRNRGGLPVLLDKHLNHCGHRFRGIFL